MTDLLAAALLGYTVGTVYRMTRHGGPLAPLEIDR